jgi:O-antigen/teichoic acid export membrane protein
VRFSATMAVERLLPERLANRLRPALRVIESIVAGDDEGSRAKRMSLTAFAIRIAGAAIAFVSQVLLARWMGSFEYGIFVLVWVTMIIVGNLACLGFHTTVIRYAPEYRETGKFAELRGLLVTSRLFAFALSSAVALAGAILVRLLSAHIESYYVMPFYLGMLTLPMIALSDVLDGTARANSWAVSALAPTYLIRPVLILVFMGVVLVTGLSPTAKAAVLSAIAATYLTTIWQLLHVTANTDKRTPPGPSAIRFREWFVVSIPIFLVESFFFLLTNADVLMVGHFEEPHNVAVYYATVKTLALIHFVYFSVKAGVAQRYAQFSGDRSRLSSFARETVSWTFWPSLAMAVLMLVVGKFMLGLFGPEFVEGYPLLFVLAAGIVARASVGPAESVLTMSGNQNACAAVYGATLGFNIALNFILIPIYGLWGAAIATGLAFMFEATALSLTVHRRLGIVMFVGARKPAIGATQ